MVIYINECIEVFGEPIERVANTPGRHGLFEVVESYSSNEEMMEQFRHRVAKLLYIPKQTRVDVEFVVSFLCMRVSCITKDD